MSNPAIGQWFNSAAYSVPAAFTYGNSSRMMPGVLSDGIVNFDTSLFKNFALTERFKLEVRAEAFNLLNTVTFDTPNGSISSTTFGVVSAEAYTPGPRKMELALRLTF